MKLCWYAIYLVQRFGRWTREIEGSMVTITNEVCKPSPFFEWRVLSNFPCKHHSCQSKAGSGEESPCYKKGGKLYMHMMKCTHEKLALSTDSNLSIRETLAANHSWQHGLLLNQLLLYIMTGLLQCLRNVPRHQYDKMGKHTLDGHIEHLLGPIWASSRLGQKVLRGRYVAI